MPRSAIPSIVIGFRTLRVNPLRTVLSTLGVIIGVAALVAVLALGDGMEQYMREEIRKNSSVLVVQLVPVTSRDVNGVQIPDTTAPTLTVAQAESLATLPGVDLASMYVAGAALGSRGSETHATIVRGSLASLAARDSLPIAHGRFYTEDEVRAGARVAVVSAGFARALGDSTAPGSLVGETIALNGREVRVIGVMASPPPRPAPVGSAPRAEPPVALVPISIAAEHLMTMGAPPRPNIALTARAVEEVRPLHAAVERWIAVHHPEWKGRVEVRMDESRGDKAAQGILVFKLLMGTMTGISLLVGGIGIMNVLLASVVERTREIGIRKATGARQRDILVQFLSESVAISGMGSAIGALVGFLGALGVTAVMRRMATAPVQAGFSLSTFIVAASAAVLVGLVFGTYPALRAARMSPVEAMHHE